MKWIWNTLKLVVVLSTVVMLIGYGVIIGRYEYFPFNWIRSVKNNVSPAVPLTFAEKDEIFKLNEINVNELINLTPINADSLTLLASEIVYGKFHINEFKLPNSIKDTVDPHYSELTELNNIECFSIIQDHGIESNGYIFHPKTKNNRLVIYHQGHGGDFLLGKETIDYFLNKGCTVYAFCMPLIGHNNQKNIYVEGIGPVFTDDKHERLGFLKNPLTYFISPVRTMLNYAESKKFKDITMIGLSGGGWTTSMSAAIDKRINYSFPVAGGYPLYIRFSDYPKNLSTCFEDTYEPLYQKINHLELAMLGSIGEGRKQVQIFNEFDDCCFSGRHGEHYEQVVKKRLEAFEFSNFDLVIDSIANGHEISEFACDLIWNEMN